MNRWGALLLAGWLAEALAGPDHNVEAAIEAYRAADYEGALSSLDAAEAERGEQPELHYNRGLILAAQGDLDGARKAFERGTEAEEANVRASSAYELGNLDFDVEDYEAAIDRYIDCLKADPTHDKAKWNLELAKAKLEQQQEEQEKNEDEKNEDENNGDGDGDQQDGGDGDQNQDEQDQNGDGDGDGDGDESETGDESGGDGDGDGDGDQEQGEQEQGEQEQGEQEQGEQEQGEQEQGEQEQGDGQSQPAAPIQRADLTQALEDLDEQDNFMLTRPQGGGRKRVKQDW